MSGRPTRLPGGIAETQCASATPQQFAAGEIALLPVLFIKYDQGAAAVQVVEARGRSRQLYVSAAALRREVGL